MDRTVLVVAPHPDDEVLGAGGTIAKLAKNGADVHVAIVTKGNPPLFTRTEAARCRREALQAHKILGVAKTHFLDFPAAALDTVPHHRVNARLGGLIRQLRPDTVFAPFPGDLHLDHQRTFLSTLVAVRPNAPGYPSSVYAYETLSETNWNAPQLSPHFQPNVFWDITGLLDRKIRALEAYASQTKPFPHERSIDVVRSLAALRGGTVGVRAAEAFVLIRQTKS